MPIGKSNSCKPRPGRLAYSSYSKGIGFSRFDYLIENPQDFPRAIVMSGGFTD